MTDQEKDALVCKALGIAYVSWWYGCDSCGREYEDKVTNFDTPEGFFKLMKLGAEKYWWNDFLNWRWKKRTGKEVEWGDSLRRISPRDINPIVMREALIEYLKERKILEGNNGLPRRKRA